MEKEDWAIMPAATLTPQPQAYVTLSDPLINVAFVLVARGSAPIHICWPARRGSPCQWGQSPPTT